MKAIVYHHYGSPDVLAVEDIEQPVSGDDEILVRVHTASLNPVDWHYVRGTPYILRLGSGLTRPRVTRLGVDFSGTVEAVGSNVSQFRPGDDVFGCRTGAFAEYLCVREEGAVAHKPENVSFEQAASLGIAALTALQGLRDRGDLQRGQSVLINGASGGVGTFAVQIARSLGAQTTGVCSSRNVDLAKSLGADHVIDYTLEDFTRLGRRFDIMLDNVGNHELLACRDVLNPEGRYVLIGGGRPDDGRWIGGLARLIKTHVLSTFVSQKMGGFLADLDRKDLIILGDLVGDGTIVPTIDRRYHLEEIPEGLRYLEEGHARGKLIVNIDEQRV